MKQYINGHPNSLYGVVVSDSLYMLYVATEFGGYYYPVTNNLEDMCILKEYREKGSWK